MRMSLVTEQQRTSPALDARFALLGCLAYSVSLFFVDTWFGMLAFGGVLVCAGAYCRVSLARLLAGLAPLSFIVLCTAIAQIPYGLERGAFYCVRILLLVSATLIIAQSYDDASFVRAFESLLSPLRLLRVPIDDIATMFSIALRFIPECLNEWNRVVASQRCRGARFDQGNLIERSISWGKVFTPMLVGLFRNAESLSCALESRCYGACARKTSLHGKSQQGLKRWALLGLSCVAFMALGIIL